MDDNDNDKDELLHIYTVDRRLHAEQTAKVRHLGENLSGGAPMRQKNRW
jgi:hypothetical protein